MIYRSNLTAPDLRPYFEATTKFEVRPWSMGHEVPSDKEYDPDCCFLTDDEAAILYNVARAVGGRWADIGGRTGWTTAHIVSGAFTCISIDPAYGTVEEIMSNKIADRWYENLFSGFLQLSAPIGSKSYYTMPVGEPAAVFFSDFSATEPPHRPVKFCGVMIDGDHDEPQPLNDARGALQHLAETGVIVFHDFWGRPIRQGVEYLIEQGLKCRVYNTPAGMAVCWRRDFVPPDHVPDPAIDWAQVRASRAPEFDFSRCL